MSSKKARPVTTQMSTITVKVPGPKGVVTKKVLLPSTFMLLKKNIAKIFKETRPIEGFTNELGTAITDIRNITPNSVVKVVFAGSRIALDSKRAENKSNVSLSLKKSSDSLLSNESKSSKSSRSSKSKGVSIIPKRKEGSQHKTLTLSLSNNEILSDSYSSEDEEIEQPQMSVTPTLKPPQKGKAAAPVQQKAATPATKTLKSQTSPVPKSKIQNYSSDYDYETDSEEEDSIETTIQKLIHTVLPEFNDDEIMEAFNLLPQECQDLFRKQQKIEATHESRYYFELLKLFRQIKILPDLSTISEIEELRKKAKTIIEQNRNTSEGGSNYLFRVGITGPAKSGKSSFLGIFAQQLVLDLIATDQWKSVFIFASDFADLFMQIDDLAEFYHSYIHLLFQFLGAQLPSHLQYLPSLEKCFQSVTSTRGYITIPRKITQNNELKRLVTDIQSMLSDLSKLWFSPSAMPAWLNYISLLPYLIGKAFGFRQTLFIYDHFESADRVLSAAEPFGESTNTEFLIETWKSATIYGPFILAAGDSVHFNGILDSTQDYGLNINSYMSLFPTTDLIPNPKYTEKEIIVEIEGISENLRVSCAQCGGVPTFLAMWNEIHEYYDRLNDIEEGAPEYDEAKCNLINKTEIFLARLFVNEDGDTLVFKTNATGEELCIRDVRIRTIQTNNKKA